MDGQAEDKGQTCGGLVLFPADASIPGLGLLPSREVRSGGSCWGLLVPEVPQWRVAVSPHTEISYVVPPTPDTFLTSVCRVGLVEGPGGPVAGPRRARPGDCPLSLLGGVFS